MIVETISPAATDAPRYESLPLVVKESVCNQNEEAGSGISSPLSTYSSINALSRSAHEYPGCNIPTTQRVIVTPKVGPQLNLECKIVPVRDPAPDEAVVRIEYTGICRSDACFSMGPEPGFPEFEHIAGHEGIGKVVKAHDPTLIGRTVGIRYLASSCQSCTYCLRGLPTSCPFQLNAPKHISGTFQEFATVPTRCLLLLPDSLMATTTDHALYATALCSGSAALMSLKHTNTKPGDVIVVFGILGGIGHMVGSIAKNVMGLKVVGIDLKHKFDALPACAGGFADSFLPATAADDVEAWPRFIALLHEACTKLRPAKASIRGAEAAVICSSSIGAFKRVDECVCDGGSIVCSGVPRGDVAFAVPLAGLVERGLHVHGTLMGGNSAALQVMDYINMGIVKPLVTIGGLEDVPKYMQRLLESRITGKIVIKVNSQLS